VGDDVGGIVATNEVVVVVVLGVFVGKALGADVGLVVSVFHKKVGV
jgi:integral membrane sensor domain MASE1